MRSVHVAHVVATFPPYWAGTGNVAHHNALELARRGHRVEVLTASVPLDGYRDPEPLVVHRLPTPMRFGNAPLTPGLLAMLPRFELIHLHWPYIFGADLTWLTATLGRIPYVVSYHHDLRADIRWQFGPYQALLGPLLLRGAARVMPVSLDHFQHSSVYRHVSGRPSKVIPIPNGVELARFRPDVDGRALRARLGIAPDETVVGYLGAMDRAHSFKGVPVLLDALAASRTRPLLLAVGGGDQQTEYQTRANALGLRSVWTGRVSAEDLATHVAAMDSLVLPSLGFGAESFGIVLVEAMSAGKPVIATSLPGVRTVVDDGVDGFLVSPGNAAELAVAIDRLVDDAELRRRFGEAGRRKVEKKHDWRRLAEQIEEVYLSVLAERGA